MSHARSLSLFLRMQTAAYLGDGPWLWALSGRLQAALGYERPALPWYAEQKDVTPLVIAWEREHGFAGFYNRHWRKRDRYAHHVLVQLPAFTTAAP